MPKAAILAACCAALVAAAGCSKGSSIRTVDDFAARMVSISAMKAVCVGEAPQFAVALVNCKQQSQAHFQDHFFQLVADGIVLFDAQSAQACADEAEALFARCFDAGALIARDQFEPLSLLVDEPVYSMLGSLPPPACNTVFSGTIPLGSACFDLSACGPGSYCRFRSNSNPTTACTRLSGPDEPCGAYCGIGLSCVLAEDGEQRCRPVGGLGDACPAHACVNGLVCKGGVCSLRPIGIACATDADCFGTPCTDGFCQSLPGCLEEQAAVTCPGNQICTARGPPLTPDRFGACAVPHDVGGACTPGPFFQGTSAGCFTHLLCDPQTSRCSSPGSIGSPCVQGQCDPYSASCDASGACQGNPGGQLSCP
jgi:hypothetical protein